MKNLLVSFSEKNLPIVKVSAALSPLLYLPEILMIFVAQRVFTRGNMLEGIQVTVPLDEIPAHASLTNEEKPCESGYLW